MTISLRNFAFSVAAAASLAALAPASEGWYADFDEAVKVAKAETKDLFVDFTGSDWCGWCIKLDKEVFSTPEFLEAAKKNFVLVALDFPRAAEVKAKVPNPKRNDELRDKYEVGGYPTILLMTPEGDVFGQTGYVAGGPRPFLENLETLRTKGKKELGDARAAVAAYEAAQGEARLAEWDKLAGLFDSVSDESVAVGVLAAPVRSALEFDKDNAQGRKKRAVSLLLKRGKADDATFAAGRELDPRNADGILERCVRASFERVRDDDEARKALTEFDALVAMGPIKDKETNFFLHIVAASWCFEHLDDLPRAKAYAAKAKEIGTDNEGAKEFLERVLGS
jgi:thioredoxin-related protein